MPDWKIDSLGAPVAGVAAIMLGAVARGFADLTMFSLPVTSADVASAALDARLRFLGRPRPRAT
jgi:hypothetical protein